MQGALTSPIQDNELAWSREFFHFDSGEDSCGDPPSAFLAALQCQEERVKALINSVNGSLTLLRNLREISWLSSKQGITSEHLSVEREVCDIQEKIRELEDILWGYLPLIGCREENASRVPISALWIPEVPPHRNIERFLRSTFGASGLMLKAQSCNQAREILKRDHFDLLITGYRIGDENGIELLKSLREEGIWSPAIMATGKGDEALAARCMEAGFVGYVSSRMLSDEEGVRATFQRALRQALEIRRWALSLRRVGRLAMTDGLTSLYNRVFTEHLLEMEIRRSFRYGYPFCVALLDLDGFKAINDTYGHAFGDEVLKRLSALLKNTARSTDHIGRYGGDEFLLVLPQTMSEDALKVCARIVTSVRDEGAKGNPPLDSLSLSIGMSCWQGHERPTLTRVLEETDRALYEAKRRGRNRIHVVRTT